MRSEKLDIHNRKKSFVVAYNHLKADDSIIPENRELIIKFVRDCRLGKTIKKQQKKVIGESRCLKYIYILTKLSTWLDKPFDKVSQEDMETLIEKLNNDELKFCSKSNGKDVGEQKTFAHSTKVDYKKTIRKFYKWLLGDSKEYPALVEWIETYDIEVEISALTKEEAEKMASAQSLRNRAIIMSLFDGGFRIEEFLNVKLKDVTFVKECVKVRIVHSKTKPRTIHLPIAYQLIETWIKSNPDMKPDDYLFPVSYDSIRVMLRRTGLKILGRSVHPHLLRHSSVTYYATFLSDFQLRYRYGWSMSSKMPNRYIDREGLVEKESVVIVEKNRIEVLRIENQKLREELGMVNERCDLINEKLTETQVELNGLFQGRGLLKLFDALLELSEQRRTVENIELQDIDLILT